MILELAGFVVVGVGYAHVAGNRAARQRLRPVQGYDLTADLETRPERVMSGCRIVGGPVPDPGHPAGMPLVLHAAPAVYGATARVLECWNGTRDSRTGMYARCLIPAWTASTDPVVVAAATYGVAPEHYAAIRSRT